MARPLDGPAVADPNVTTNTVEARAHRVLGSSVPLVPDHRESSDTYPGELLSAGQGRVAVCPNGLQWLIQRRRFLKAGVGGAWDSVSFCQTRAALVRPWRARTDQDGTALLRLLPEHVPLLGRGGRDLLVAPLHQKVNQGQTEGA